MNKRPVYYGDFETTQPNEQGKVRVYLWCLSISEKSIAWGSDIESFMKLILKRRAIIYFHNLKFDSSYILYYLITNNIVFDVCEKQGIIYSIKFEDIELRDSLNFIPCSLREIGETYCTKYKKLDYDDYAKPYDYKPTYEDIKYCKYDVLTLREGLTNYLNELTKVLKENGAIKTANKVHKKLTNAGISYEAFKEITNIEHICERTTRDMYNLIKGSYSGGFVFARGGTYTACPDYSILMLDENSMYPDKYANAPMPIGKHFTIDEGDIFKPDTFAIISISIRFHLKSGYFPIIGQGFSKSGSTIYMRDSEDFINLVITSVDFAYILKFYQCEWLFNWGIAWYTKKGVFKPYADIFMKVKAESKGVRREVAKKLLNMCYGKTAMSGITETKSYFINDNGVVSSEITELKEDDNLLQYFQIGIAICSYAHADLWGKCEALGCDNVLSTDTDSIKFKCHNIDVLNNIPVDNKKLGYWKVEGSPQVFKPLAPKKYIYYEAERLHITSAGFNHAEVFEALGCPYHKNDKGQYESLKLSQNEALTYIKRFDFGLQVYSKQSRLVEGGRLISEVLKEIKKPSTMC